MGWKGLGSVGMCSAHMLGAGVCLAADTLREAGGHMSDRAWLRDSEKNQLAFAGLWSDICLSGVVRSQVLGGFMFMAHTETWDLIGGFLAGRC